MPVLIATLIAAATINAALATNSAMERNARSATLNVTIAVCTGLLAVVLSKYL